MKGRRATLTLTDNKGFSRDLTIYQGDRSAADDALSVEAVNASGRVDVTAEGEGFDVIYPSSYNRLDVYATSGQLVVLTLCLPAVLPYCGSFMAERNLCVPICRKRRHAGRESFEEVITVRFRAYPHKGGAYHPSMSRLCVWRIKTANRKRELKTGR